jgi:type I restriction enzyme M protein
LNADETRLRKAVRVAERTLDERTLGQYARLTDSDIKVLAVDDKWLGALGVAIQREMERLSSQLTGRLAVLASRYQVPLSETAKRVSELDSRVSGHLVRMGFSWR